MKKIMVIALGMIFCLAATLPSFAIELQMNAVEEHKVTGNYAKVKDGKVVFGKQPTAYSPETLNMILNAYGVSLAADAVSAVQAVSKGYASVNKDGQVAFGKVGTAYSPETLHTILTAYGNENGKLFLSPEAAGAMKDPPNYVKVKEGKLAFGKQSTAYSPEEFNMLLGAYQLPGGKAAPPVVSGPGPGPAPEPDRPAEPAGPRGPCSDKDGDGVCDENDDCPDTPKGAYVNARGCWIVENLLFDFDKSVIKSKYYKDLDEVVRVLNDNPYLNVEIQGHTCTIGTDRYNQRLSDRRA
jgi:OOP family OmpA-OmpF porin